MSTTESHWEYIRLRPEQVEILLESLDLAASVSAYPLEDLTAVIDAIHSRVVEVSEPGAAYSPDSSFAPSPIPDFEVLEVATVDPFLFPPINRMPEWTILTCVKDGQAFFYPKMKGKLPQLCLRCIGDPLGKANRLAAVRRGIDEQGRPYIRVRPVEMRSR